MLLVSFIAFLRYFHSVFYIFAGDLDVFNTFISAIFYVGKGKRARPYSHLHEAIKHMQKPTDKVF